MDNFKSLLEKVQGICFNYENHNCFFSKPLVTGMTDILVLTSCLLTPDVKVICLTIEMYYTKGLLVNL